MSLEPRTYHQSNAVQILDEKLKYQGYFQATVYQLRVKKFTGEWSQPMRRELFQRQQAVGVLLYDPKQQHIVLIEQFRIGALHDKRSPWLLEVVAGIVDSDESLEAVAKREVFEETGLQINKLQKIYDYWVSPGGSNEHFTLFYAEIDAQQAGGVFGLADEHEDIRTQIISLAQARVWVADGLVNNAAAIIALQWLFLQQEAG